MDAEIFEIFADFSKKKFQKISPIDFNRSEISDISISAEISDVPAGWWETLFKIGPSHFNSPDQFRI